MFSDFQLLPPDSKARVLRAFLSLKRSNDFQELSNFIAQAEQETLRDLVNAPLETVPTHQGRAQILGELRELLAMANEDEINRLLGR